MCEGEGCVRERGWWGGGATTLHIANYIVINVPVNFRIPQACSRTDQVLRSQ